MITESKPISIATIFSGDYRFKIPVYQRPYAWSEDEILRLVNDIIDKQTDNYYIGCIIVKKTCDKDGVVYYEIIDGQQRITTLLLLYLYLDKSMVKSTNVLTFELREKTSDETISRLYSGANIDDNCCDWGIKKGYEIIAGFFNDSKHKEQLESIKEYLKNTFVFFVDLPVKTDLNHYFEIMNTRGEQLKPTDIVKERIFRMLGTNEKELAAANIIWTACENMNGYVQQNFKKKDRSNIFGNKLIELNDCVNEKNIFKYINGDNKTKKHENKVELLKILINENEYYDSNFTEESDKNTMQRLRYNELESIITFANFLLQVKIIFDKYYLNKSENDNITYLLDDKNLLDRFSDFVYKSIDTDDIKKQNRKARAFLFCMLKCRQKFDMYIIKRLKNDKKEGENWELKFYRKNFDYDNYSFPITFGKAFCKTNINSDAYDFEKDKTNDYKLIKTLEESLRITYTSPNTMEWISLVLDYVYKRNISDISSIDFLHLLENYSKEKVRESRITEINSSILSGEEKYKYDNFSRISFTYLDYLLYKNFSINSDVSNELLIILERFFKNGNIAEKFKNEIHNWEIVYRNSIEHFFPQSVDKSTGLKDWSYKNLHQFGNLALVSVFGNSKFSNGSPKEKMEKKQIINQSLKLILMSKITEYNGNWTEDVSIKFGKCMIEILNKNCEM